jgi:thiol:disulfide interchange protein
MKQIFLFFCSAAILFFACHSAKKTTHSSTKKTKPKTSQPAKTSSTVPKKAETPVKNPATELVFVESDNLSSVLEQAQKEKKPVFIEFYADWCAPCKILEQEVFTQKPTYSYLNKNFINYSVDFASESGKRIASIFEVSTLPTIIFVNPQGVLLERKTNGITHSSITTLGDAALKTFKSQ